MTKEFMFGFLMAIPCYAAILFLFRDIIIARIFKNVTAKAIPLNEHLEEIGQSINFDNLKSDVIDDILTSYRLILIIKYEFEFLLNRTKMSDESQRIISRKLEYINATIKDMEQLFDANDRLDDCLSVQRDVAQLISSSMEEDD